MGKVTGFKEFNREVEPYRSPKKRVLDFKEIYTDHDESSVSYTHLTLPTTIEV